MNKKAPFILIASAALLASLSSCGSSSGGSDSSSSTEESTSEKAGSSSSSSAPSSSSESSSSTQSSSSSSEPQSDTGSSSEPSSSSEEAKHDHVYNNDHICPEDGYSDPGKLAVDLDGELTDAKWTALSAENSLSDIASDGRGMKIKGFTSGDYAYFAFEVFSKTNAFADAEIIFNADNATDSIASLSEGKTSWSGKFVGAVAKTEKLESGLYRSCVEIAAKSSEVLSSDGTLMASFGARVAAEQSDSSYMEDNKPEYWVLKGLNPWGGKGSAFNVDANGIHHTHSYDNGSCIWCGNAAPSAKMAITVDGDLSDWDASIMKKYIGSSDEEDRYFGWNAFTDDTYLYLTAKLAHKGAGVDKLNLLSTTINTVETTVAKRSGSDYVFSGPGLIKGGYKETTDDATGLTSTVYEMVFAKDPWTSSSGVINIGVLALLPSLSDSSEHFDINHAEIPGYWGITSAHNAWGEGGRFNVTSSGVEHTHSYQGAKCLICDEALAINPDGDLSDWDADIKKKYIGSTDSEGRHFGWNAFVDDDYLYITAKLTHKASHITHLRMLKDSSAEYNVAINSGETYTFAGPGIIAGDCQESKDSSTGLTTTVFELVFEKASWADSQGEVKIGLLASLDSTADASEHFDINHSGIPGYWGITSAHNAWGADGRFSVTSGGVSHNHSYQNGHCTLCNEADSTYKVVLDGDASDWGADIKKKYIGSTDSEGRHFGWNAFLDGDYLYVTATLAHKADHIEHLRMLKDGNAEVNIALFSGSSYSLAGDGFVSGGQSETKDAGTGLTTTTFELVFQKSNWADSEGNVIIGLLATLDSTLDASEHFDINHSGKPGYWGITSAHNAWGAGGRFSVASSGVQHEHSYQNGKCKICDATEPVPAVTVNGSLSDFPDVAASTKITNSSSNGESISLCGFVDEDFVYVGLEVKTTSASVGSVDLINKSGTWWYSHAINYTDGVVSITAPAHDYGVISCAATRAYNDVSSLYTYVFEFALTKSLFAAEDNGNVKIGVGVGGCDSNDTIDCDHVGNPGYWGINGLNGWAGEARCFTFGASGVSAPSVSAAGE